MKTRLIAASTIGLCLGASGITISGSASADEIRSNSPTGTMYMGGGPGPGEAVADRIVVTRRVQFAEYGREGLIKPLSAAHLALNDGELVSDSAAEAPLRPVKVREDAQGRLPRDRFGRE